MQKRASNSVVMAQVLNKVLIPPVGQFPTAFKIKYNLEIGRIYFFKILFLSNLNLVHMRDTCCFKYQG